MLIPSTKIGNKKRKTNYPGMTIRPDHFAADDRSK